MWQEVTAQLSRFTQSEFEDYRPRGQKLRKRGSGNGG
jgi:hypothetical protein